MKLYVWADPYAIRYGTSGLFVVAESEEQAREIAKRGKTYSYMEFEEQRPAPPVPDGPPTRVVDLPCAEWHEWSE